MYIQCNKTQFKQQTQSHFETLYTMAATILANDSSGLSITTHINKVIRGYDQSTCALAKALTEKLSPSMTIPVGIGMELPTFWKTVHTAVTEQRGRLESREGEEVLRAVHRNRKAIFDLLWDEVSWPGVVGLWVPVSLTLIPQLKAIIPIANEATDGKMDLWLTGVEEPRWLTGTDQAVTPDTSCHSGWVQMAHFLLFDKVVELHSSDFEHKLLRCYGPLFQEQDKRVIRDTLDKMSIFADDSMAVAGTIMKRPRTRVSWLDNDNAERRVKKALKLHASTRPLDLEL
jgi:hypothetical protein